MNMNRLAGGLVAAVIAAAAALASPFTSTAAVAHTPSVYYTQRWPNGANVAYGFNSGFPGGSYGDRVHDGKQQWNAVAGSQEPMFFWTLNDYVSYGSFQNPCGMSSGTNTAVWFRLDLDPIAGSEAAGATNWCYVDNTIRRASLAFDSTRSNYYTGTGSVPSGSVDAWSVATHEWGHSTGWRWHFAEGESGVCDSYTASGRNTMCPAIANGTSMQRNLATHDIHTFTAAYW